MKRMILMFIVGFFVGLKSADAGSLLEKMDSRGDMLGWEAVGRLDIGGKGYCTGTLIAPDLVLTAAHCLYDHGTLKPLPAERFVFKSGYLHGDALSVRAVEKYVIADGYRHMGRMMTSQNIPHDVALMRLVSPIYSSEADPFRLQVGVETGMQVQVMSYGQGRDEAMSWQRDCAVTQTYKALIGFDCDITFGSSGAPVFVKTGTRVRIMSLVSAMGKTQEGQDLALGMALDGTVARLKQRLRVGDAPALQSSAGVKRLRVGDQTRAGGAKFLKP